MASNLQARLKPFDPKRGRLTQRLTISQLDGKRYEQGFWYAVSEAEADVLLRVGQRGIIYPTADEVPEPAAFDVLSLEEARALQQSETRAVLLPTSGDVSELMIAPSREDVGDEPKPASPGPNGPPARRVGARRGPG